MDGSPESILRRTLLVAGTSLPAHGSLQIECNDAYTREYAPGFHLRATFGANQNPGALGCPSGEGGDRAGRKIFGRDSVNESAVETKLTGAANYYQR
jgi:hypothetical protein